MQLAERVVRRAGIVTRMAPRTIIRSLSRIAVAVAALMVAVSVIIGVGVMISSFRSTVVLWLDDVLQADIFISPPSAGGTGVAAALDPKLLAQLGALPGDHLRGHHPGRRCERPGRARRRRRFLCGWSPSAATWREKIGATGPRSATGRRPGRPWRTARSWSMSPWRTGSGSGSATLCGCRPTAACRASPSPASRSISTCASVAFMADPVYRSWFDDDRISAIGLFVAPGVDVDAASRHHSPPICRYGGTAGTLQPGHAPERAGRLRSDVYHHGGAADSWPRSWPSSAS